MLGITSNFFSLIEDNTFNHKWTNEDGGPNKNKAVIQIEIFSIWAPN